MKLFMLGWADIINKSRCHESMGERLFLFPSQLVILMLMNLTEDQLQLLHQAVIQIDYPSLFSYYGYRLEALGGGSWMIAKAIQAVAGGDLYYVGLNDGNPCATFVHAVVKLADNTFIDGRGRHTYHQILQPWAHLPVANPYVETYLEVQPLFCFPDGVERNEEVIAQIHWLLEHQLRVRGDVQVVARFQQLIEQELDTAAVHRRLRAQPQPAAELAGDDIQF